MWHVVVSLALARRSELWCRLVGTAFARSVAASLETGWSSFHLITSHCDTSFKENWSFLLAEIRVFVCARMCVHVCLYVCMCVCVIYRHIPRKLFQALGLSLMKTRAWLQRAAIQSNMCGSTHTDVHTRVHRGTHTTECKHFNPVCNLATFFITFIAWLGETNGDPRMWSFDNWWLKRAI